MNDVQRKDSRGDEYFSREGMVSSWVGWVTDEMRQRLVWAWMAVVH